MMIPDNDAAHRIEKLSQYLVKQKEKIGEDVLHFVIKETGLQLSIKEQNLRRENLVNYTQLLGGALVFSSELYCPKLIGWSYEQGKRNAHYRGKLEDILKAYSKIRQAYLKIINTYCVREETPIWEFSCVNGRFLTLIDSSITELERGYVEFGEELLKEAREEVSRLSAPVVPIKDGLAVLPLIGSIDAYRAKHILNRVVPKVTELEIHCLIVDFSGIHMIDTLVVEYLFKIQHVLRLLGIEAVVTGIQPETAQAVVQMGINFSGLRTYATVKQALEKMVPGNLVE